MADLAASAEFKLLDFLSLGLNLGYRWANIPSMKVIKGINVDLGGGNNVVVNSNDPLTNNSGKELAVDFSGINVGIGVHIGF
jgi:hypothetical protein